MRKSILFALFFTFVLSNLRSQVSVAHQWSDEILFCIRNDFARPPIHARNLYHISVVMHDAFAAYVPGSKTILLDNEWQGFYSPFYGVPIPEDPQDIQSAQEEAISYAAYRLLMWRFQNAPGFAAIFDELFNKMNQLGYDINFTSVDYINDGPAALGNYIAQQMIAFGLQDGSNESGLYANLYYTDGNPLLEPELPGNPNMINPNRFQRLSLSNAIDQAGNPIPGSPPHLAPEWGNVTPFSLKIEDSEVLERNGEFYRVYHNPGAPPYIDTNVQTGLEDFFKWNFVMVSVWQSHLDTTDNVMWDISPASRGNVAFEDYPTTFAEYQTFYDYFNGGDNGTGYAINPVTNQPYAPQLVRRGDYARVLAEFWADGLDSETPPGHWFNIYNEISQHPLFIKQWKGQGPLLSDLEYDVHAYLLLGGAMHDAAIGAWGVKGYYDYVRPVSAIRYMGDKGQSSDPLLPNYHQAGLPLVPGYVELVMAGDPLVGSNNEHLHKIKLYTWRGHDYIEDTETDMAGVGWILAENWWPYQRPSFVTPPFAGYVSGHSTYSRAAARVMDFMTGTPYFPGGMSNFVAEQNDFLEFEVGPSQNVILQWATYYDASNECSLSRIWGGIHPVIDDIPGRKIGQQVGNDASTFVDSLYLLELPVVVDLELNTDLVNITQIDQQLELTISFNQDMNTGVNPTIEFLGFSAANDLFTILSQSWLSATEFQIIYTIEDLEVQAGFVPLSVFNAENLAEIRQSPYLLMNELYIDTKAPVLVSYSLSSQVLNSQSTSICVTMNFDEPCEPTFQPVLEWSGVQNIQSALVFNAGNSSWISSTSYLACYDFDAQLISIAGYLSFEITNVVDNGENEITSSIINDALFVDVAQPVINVTANQPLLNISSIGNNAITITLSSNKAMSNTILPVLNFSDNALPITTLSLNTFLSSWTDEFTCNLVYNLGSSPVDYSNIDINITNITDVSGNPPAIVGLEDVFILDTKRPETELIVSNYGYINDLAVTDANFFVDVTFSEAMNQTSFTPLLAINDALGSAVPGVTYNVFQSSWQSSTVYRARFNVTDLNMEMDELTVAVAMARDISNNAMLSETLTATFSLDTRNPQLVSFEISETSFDQNSSTVFITSSFDEPMLESNIPIFMAVTVDGDEPMFTPVLAEGEWLDDFTYSGTYIVSPFYYVGPAGIRVTTASDLASNVVVDTVLQDQLTIDFLYLSSLEYTSNEFIVYPNPLQPNGLLNIVSDQEIYSVRIFDLMGSIVYEMEVLERDNNLSFLLPNIASGTYVLSVNTNNSVSTSRIQVIK